MPARLGVRLLLGSALAFGVVTACAPASARADSCLRANFEKVQLQLIDARQDGELIDAPARLATVGAMYVSDLDPDQVYFPDGGAAADTWAFALAEPSAPAPAVARYLAALPPGEISGCTGKPLPYAPLRPGRYAPVARTMAALRGVTGTSMIVHPGRDELWLRATLGRQRVVVRYRITCAMFVGTLDETCAPNVPCAGYADGADEPCSLAAADGAPQPPIALPAVAPDAQPAAAPADDATPQERAPAPAPIVAGRPGCRGCGAAGTPRGSLGLVGGALVAAGWRRRRRRASVSRPCR